MIKGLAFVLLVAPAAAVMVELNSTQLSDQKYMDQLGKAKQTYTLSTEALKAKVQAEAQKVENARAASHQSLAQMRESAASMTQAARLQEMSMMIEGKDKGMEMIKSLSAEAKDALAGLQKKWLDISHDSMERFQDIMGKLPSGVESVDPEKENAHIGAFMPIEEIVHPFMNHMKELQTSYPELNPWVEKVQDFSSFLQKDNLEEMFAPNLPRFKKYKQEFNTYSKAHQEKLMAFMEEFEMDDILTVLQSPEF